jgi:hypothetical protein
MLALAGIVVPVILHLLNDRKGRVVRIGSVGLLAGPKRRTAWRPRISQWWLLVLRSLLVAALALLLAGPYVLRAPVGKGWVLVGNAGKTYLPVIDSLVSAGYEYHELTDTTNYWDGFRAADAQAPAGLSFYVFTTGLARRFSGPRPVTARVVNWFVFAPSDSVVRWDAAAWLDSGNVGVLRGESRGTGTTWLREKEPELAAVANLDSVPLRYRIIADGASRGDGKYVRAALKTLSGMTGRPIEEGDGGWLFWLSDRPLPLTDTYRRVFCYARGATRLVDTRMASLRMTREIEGGSVDSAVWRDGFGHAVLARRGKVYYFFSRLNPEWGDLVWSGEWPVLLEGLVLGEVQAGTHDRRVLDPGQIRPLVEASAGNKAAGLERGDLKPALWVLLLLLFLAERSIATFDGRKKT